MLATIGFGLKDSYKKEDPLILGLINILKNKNHQFQVWVKFYWILAILSVISIIFIRLYGSSFMMGLVLVY